MSMPNQIDTYVEKRFMPRVVDIVTTHDPFFERLWAKKEVKVGGTGTRVPLRYGENTNVGTYQPHGDFRKVVPETKTHCNMGWANYYANVLLSRLQALQAKGEAALLTTLVKDQIEEGELAMRGRITNDIVHDGSTYTWPPLQGEAVTPIEGLQKVLTQDNSYGGIDASTEMITNGVKLWNCYRLVGPTGATTYGNLYLSTHAAYLPMLLRQAIGEVTDGVDGPTLGIMPQHLYDALWRCAFDKAEAGSMEKTKIGKLGYTAIEFEGIPFIVNKHMPLGKIWLLNERYLILHVLAGAALTWTGFNQTQGDSKMGQILLSMALLCSNRNKQAEIYDLSDNRS